MRIISITLALGLLGLASHAQAYQLRRFCTPQGSCFVCARGSPTCEITYALSRGMTFPSVRNNHPGPVYSERLYREQPPLPGEMMAQRQQRRPSKEEWRAAIMNEAQKFCDAYPQDQQCHWKGPPQEAPTQEEPPPQ